MRKIIRQVRELFHVKLVTRNNFFIFIGSLCLGGFMLVTRMNSVEPTKLRLGYSFFGSINEIDPANIQTIYQSNIIENIFSRLIEYDNAGQINCTLCTSFKVEKNEIYFSFTNLSKTVDGYSLDANAAKKSFDRILASQTNTHGSLGSYLDSKHESPIEVIDSNLIVRIAKDEWVPFALSLLTSMDFSIIPIESLDNSNEKIVDYRNTSGPYYVDFSDDKGNLQLKANPNHRHFLENKNCPKEVIFVPISSGQASQAFIEDKIDMIDPTYYAYQDDIEKILMNVSEATVHRTLNIGLTSLVFTKKAMSDSDEEDRLNAALAIKKIFLNKTPKIFEAIETNQFFQSFGQGFISSEQAKVLKDRIARSSGTSNYKFILGVTEKYRSWFDQRDFPDFITLKFFKQFPGFLPDSEKPDIYLMTGDSSFDEDISALSYLFSQGTFSLNKEDGARWIGNYMDIPKKEDRIKLLQDLHFEMLKSVKVFPIMSRPYITISNSKWSFDFPKIYAGTPLWRSWAR